jgi:hypothetical protein
VRPVIVRSATGRAEHPLRLLALGTRSRPRSVSLLVSEGSRPAFGLSRTLDRRRMGYAQIGW